MSANNALIVAITPDYRLTADERNYTLQRRHIVDPTRSPWFNAETHSAEQREKWRDIGFYTLNAAGLARLVEVVAIRTVNDRTSFVTIAEIVAEYRVEVARLSQAIITAMAPDLGALEAAG